MLKTWKHHLTNDTTNLYNSSLNMIYEESKRVQPHNNELKPRCPSDCILN